MIFNVPKPFYDSKSWASKWSLLELHCEPGLQQGRSKGRLGLEGAMVVAKHDADGRGPLLVPRYGSFQGNGAGCEA